MNLLSTAPSPSRPTGGLWHTLRLAAIGAIMAVSLVTYGAATVLFGVLDKATIQRLMRRQS